MIKQLTYTNEQAEDLLYREAELLDSCDFEAWLDLYTEDCLYWIPLTPDQTDPSSSPSHVSDSREALAARVLRLKDPANLPQQPPSRCSRLLGRVQLLAEAQTPAGAELGTKTTFHLVECVPYFDSEDGQRIFAGTLTHGFLVADGNLKIHSKRIDLLNSDKGMHGFSIII